MEKVLSLQVNAAFSYQYKVTLKAVSVWHKLFYLHVGALCVSGI